MRTRILVVILLRLLSAQAFRPGLNSGEMLGRLIFVLQAASHDFKEVVALVFDLIMQVCFCLLDKLFNCRLLLNSMLVHNSAEWVIRVLVQRFERVLLARVKTMLYLLLHQWVRSIHRILGSSANIDGYYLSLLRCDTLRSVVL